MPGALRPLVPHHCWFRSAPLVCMNWGRPNLFVPVDVGNERALTNLVMEKVQSIDRVESTETHTVTD